MPRSTDPSSTLPPPELNPLLNPLLGKNLGRWAEVYFTTPPEQREDAVLELLRELESEPAEKPADTAASKKPNKNGKPMISAPAGSSVVKMSTMETADEEQAAPSRPSPKLWPIEPTGRDFVTCESCGTRSSQEQNFCGTCGAPLRGKDFEDEPDGQDWTEMPENLLQPTGLSVTELPRGEASRREFSSADFHLSDRHYADLAAPNFASPNFGSGDASGEHDESYERGSQLAEDVPKLLPDYSPVPYRYRLYVGATLAIVIVALVSISWRGARVRPGNSHSLPQAAPWAAPPPAAEPPALQTQKSAKAEGTASAPVEASGPSPPNAGQEANAGNKTDIAKPRISEPGKNNASEEATASSDEAPAPGMGQGNGAAELREAQGYLNGAQGKMRDSGEAARWLWQSVRRENSTAALLLSDLYLRGDGVPKSCDQARLLLDAAARKGAPGAGQRLRNLQAFGCQ